MAACFVACLCVVHVWATAGSEQGKANGHTHNEHTFNEQGNWYDKPPLPALGSVPLYQATVVLALQCPHCGRMFAGRGGLSSHLRSEGCAPIVHLPPRVAGQRRHRYTFRQKRKMLLHLDALRSAGVQFAASILALECGVSLSSIVDWEAHREVVFRLAAAPHLGGLRSYYPSLPDHVEQEYKLYVRFVWRRQYQKLRVGTRWLRQNMRQLLNGVAPAGQGYSRGWANRFCRRWNITFQCRTNTKHLSVQERLPAIRGFHQWLIHGLQRSHPQRDAKYGRFPANRMFHMDQVPLSFVPTTKKSFNAKGSRCVIADPCGTDNKRFCTLQVTICADPSANPVKLEIIFRGKGLRLSEEEKAAYAALPNITVRWQDKAWANECVILDYLMDFREATMHLGEVLLGMDNHGSQRTPACETFMELFRIVAAFTPANCTDCCSPVDHHVGKLLKELINAMYEEEYDKNCFFWNRPPQLGGLTTSNKRVLLAQWASAAWTLLAKKHEHCLRMAFVETGFLVALDGSEDKLIELWKGGKGQYTILAPESEK